MHRATDQYEDVAHRAEDSTRRIAAAIAGALEGFIDAMERYDVAQEGERAMKQAGDVARAAAVEGRAQAQTPEMQKIGHGLATAGHRTADATRHAADDVRTGVAHARENVVDAAHAARDNVRERVESAKYAVQRTAEEVKVRGQAVAETGRRARVAPGRIAHELGEAFSAWKKALVTTIAMMALIAVVGITAFIVLTMGIIAGLTLVVGWVGALFLTALLYLVVAGIAYAVSRAAQRRAAEEREERMENAREELRYVARPVKDAFSRGRGI